ncbi:MAG: endonuclease III, partial [Bradyrhizobium icense]
MAEIIRKAKPRAAKPAAKKAVKAARPEPAKAKSAKKAPKPKPWTAAEVYEAFSRFRKASPEPKGELEHLNPYTLLVAVVLSAQATDAGVNKATRALFAVADTPEKMLELGEEKVRDYIKTIGLYRNKAKNVIALSEKLLREFGGEVPRTRAEIES